MKEGHVRKVFQPLTSPNDRVEVTLAMTPIMENAKHTVSSSFSNAIVSQNEKSLFVKSAHREFATEFALVTQLRKLDIVGTYDRFRF